MNYPLTENKQDMTKPGATARPSARLLGYHHTQREGSHQ